MGIEFRRGLQKEDLAKLQRGSRIYVNTWVIGGTGGVVYPNVPVLVVGANGDEFVFVYIDENGDGKQGRLNLLDYNHTWDATVEDGFQVRTPGGCLWAIPSENGNGIFVNRQNKYGRTEDHLAQSLYCSKPTSLWFPSLGDKETAIEAKRIPLDRVKPRPSTESPVSREAVMSAPEDFLVNVGFTTYIFDNGELKSRVFHTKGDKKYDIV